MIKDYPRTSYPILILLFLSVIWGSSLILIKKGLEIFSPMQVATLRIIFAFLILSPAVIKNLNTLNKTNWKKFVLVGIFSILLPSVFLSSAQVGLSSSLTGIINSFGPISTLLIGLLLFKSRIYKEEIVGVVVGFVGTIILSFVGSNGNLGSFNFYALFVIAATISYGISINMVKIYFSKINSITLTALAIFSIGPFAIVYLLTSDFTYKLMNVEGAWTAFFYLLLLGIFSTAVALVLFNKLIQVTSPVYASAVTYLIPLVAIFWGLLDGEVLFPLHFLGMGLIIFSVFLINRNKS